MKLTINETREWYNIRDHVRDVVLRLEVCCRCWRVRDKAELVGAGPVYFCRPGDREGCLPIATKRVKSPR